MKLTTKLTLVFVLVAAGAFAWLKFYAIPQVKHFLMEREVHYARNYLEMAAEETRAWLLWLAAHEAGGAPGPLPLPPALDGENEDDVGPATGPGAGPDGDTVVAPALSQTEQDRRRLFGRLNARFKRFYFHDSGRLFVINSKGEFVVYPEELRSGRSISNRFLFEDGGRNKLIQEIVKNRGQFVQQYRATERIEPLGPVPKLLFVKYLLRTDYFVCIAVNEDDLFANAYLAEKSLTLLLVITLLAAFLVFHFFYLRLRRRFDAVMESATLIERGNYEVTINDPNSDEIGTLARTIDKLAADMRQKAHLENQLRQAQKMEMVGTLASGITHDFNNILAGITSSIDLIGRELNAPSLNGKYDLELLETAVKIASDCAIRARDTVSRMLSFARVSERHMQLLDLNSIIHNVQQICTSSFDKRIVVRTRPAAGVAVVKADRSQLEQAILNACINGRDAMTDGGELMLSIELVTEPLAHPRQPGEPPRPWFRLTVQDTGCGIAPEILPRIFEPFFTTKKSGSGLGLPMVYKIVDEHGGWVDVDSRRDMGTRLYFYLPKAGDALPLDLSASDSAIIAKAPAATPATRPAPAPAAPPPVATPAPAPLLAHAVPVAGKRGILVIDDEPHMRTLTTDILTRLGYDTIAVGDGDEAIKALEAHPERIDGVTLDLFLPRIAGPEVYEALKARKPSLKVLLTSGAKRDPRIGDLLAKGCDGFLQKPFSMEDLIAAVRQLMA